MSKAREELLQLLTEKLGCVMRSMHTGQRFPFGEFTLGASQVRILFFVAGKMGGASVKDLAEMLDVTPGAVTQLVDSLVEKDLVKRAEDSNDKRILRITLTELAESKFKQFRKDYFTSVSRVFNTLSDEEIRQLITLLAKTNIPSSAKECNR